LCPAAPLSHFHQGAAGVARGYAEGLHGGGDAGVGGAGTRAVPLGCYDELASRGKGEYEIASRL
jgi:hypothetical protein